MKDGKEGAKEVEEQVKKDLGEFHRAALCFCLRALIPQRPSGGHAGCGSALMVRCEELI